MGWPVSNKPDFCWNLEQYKQIKNNELNKINNRDANFILSNTIEALWLF